MVIQKSIPVSFKLRSHNRWIIISAFSHSGVACDIAIRIC